MKTKIQISLLYLSLHNQLVKKVGVNGIISRKDLFIKLAKHYLVPKNLREAVLKEMESMNLIKRQDRKNIKILKCDWDLEKDTHKFYRWVGLL